MQNNKNKSRFKAKIDPKKKKKKLYEMRKMLIHKIIRAKANGHMYLSLFFFSFLLLVWGNEKGFSIGGVKH